MRSDFDIDALAYHGTGVLTPSVVAANGEPQRLYQHYAPTESDFWPDRLRVINPLNQEK